ncbi:MAG TPA: sodium-dependent transporter [bacterium]|jgi:SNF family Na+-dependent transporter|nr:sodium-dependent transporter [bacterium]HPM47464.1 sodium-dependent transporter [bacterium]HRQ68667.1 sodium-dependent transporter [bacterium]
MSSPKREQWGTKLGVILAVAGSAVGLGNFLRFPTQAALGGGGAFMIPYFVSFLLLGIPLMWVEWSLGRKGGEYGHGTAPAILYKITGSRFIKYFASIGIIIPLLILFYYAFIESWSLAYAFFSISGTLADVAGKNELAQFLQGYQGVVSNGYFDSIWIAYGFFVVTIIINFYFIYKGVASGIEKLSKIAMPLLVIIAVLLVIRILTLGTPDPLKPDQSVSNALNFVWTPDFTVLLNSKVWLSAAGQIFFTLSLGMGVIMTYASYLKKNDDIALSGLTASATNEFCEVILGGSLIIPAAFIFFGSAETVRIATTGAFNIGFVTMPNIFANMPGGPFFAFLWFMLLFIAGITSSVSMIQPAVAFLEDEFGFSRKKTVMIMFIFSFLACQPVIFFMKYGFLDELDFWGGTVFLTIFATLEIVVFGWIYGIDKGWKDLNEGAEIKIPSIFRFIIKYVSPLFLFILLGVWTYQMFIPTIMMKGVPDENKPYIWGARIFILLIIGIMMYLIKITTGRKEEVKQ